MSQGSQSIEDLIQASRGNSQSDDDTVSGKFQAKQHEIKLKEVERATESKAAQLSLPYINLFGFPATTPSKYLRTLVYLLAFEDRNNPLL